MIPFNICPWDSASPWTLPAYYLQAEEGGRLSQNLVAFFPVSLRLPFFCLFLRIDGHFPGDWRIDLPFRSMFLPIHIMPAAL